MQTQQHQIQPLIHKLTDLSPEHFEEVNDFVDFLLMRERRKTDNAEISQLSEPVLAKVWDNE